MMGKKLILYFLIPCHILGIVIFAFSAFVLGNRILTICAGSIVASLSVFFAVYSSIHVIRNFLNSR